MSTPTDVLALSSSCPMDTDPPPLHLSQMHPQGACCSLQGKGLKAGSLKDTVLWLLWRDPRQVALLRGRRPLFLKPRGGEPHWEAGQSGKMGGLGAGGSGIPQPAEGLWTVPTPLRTSFSCLAGTAQMVCGVS